MIFVCTSNPTFTMLLESAVIKYAQSFLLLLPGIPHLNTHTLTAIRSQEAVPKVRGM